MRGSVLRLLARRPRTTVTLVRVGARLRLQRNEIEGGGGRSRKEKRAWNLLNQHQRSAFRRMQETQNA